MTATFGKLDHQELVLEPGLNVIHAPNEWGKSTWCAFLIAMLYGLDTRARTTQTALADKEHYAPWSGRSMSGRMDLCWKGRDITIERRTRGRTPMGDFSAFETDTGLPIPELTAANCGQTLLGVEQSVFRRAGFIRLADLPVNQDEALRARLNALVTTGDESGDGEKLAKKLKELKNTVRYNRTGLLPQAEAEVQRLETALDELDELENQEIQTERRLKEEEKLLKDLENHQAHLEADEAREDAARVEKARQDRDRELAELERLEGLCSRLPGREEAEGKLQELKDFGARWNQALLDQQKLPKNPLPPAAPEILAGMDPQEGRKMVQTDGEKWKKLKKQNFLLPLILGGVAWAAAIVLLLMGHSLVAVIGIAAGIAAVILWILGEKNRKQGLAALVKKYGAAGPEAWKERAEAYLLESIRYREQTGLVRKARADMDARFAALEQQKQALCGNQTPEKAQEVWLEVLKRWDTLEDARRNARGAEAHFADLSAVVRTGTAPETADSLSLSAGETQAGIQQSLRSIQNLHAQLGQLRGRMEALGRSGELRQALESEKLRIRKLEAVEAALTLAQETLNRASSELQRRFAPRIASRAQELMSAMTGGRYDRLRLDEDLSLQVGAGEENTLHTARWRSDGTVDQLYLALRLAVSEALTPEAPLVLDDALVRFDDTRAEAALAILAKEARTKQVILFSCQKREKEIVERLGLGSETE